MKLSNNKFYSIISGSGDNKSHALNNRGIYGYREIYLTSTLPAHIESYSSLNLDFPDMGIVMESGSFGETISAGIATADFYKGDKKVQICLAYGQGKKDASALQEELYEKLQKQVTEKGSHLENIFFEIKSLTVEKEMGVVWVGLCLDFAPIKIFPKVSKPALFLGQNASLEEAKTLILPVVYPDGRESLKERDFAPYAILHVSEEMEDYDIESDSLPSKSGIYTMSGLEVKGSPLDKIEEVYRKAHLSFRDEKFLMTLAPDHTSTLGVLKALHEIKPHFSLLALDAYSNQRRSYDGSSFSDPSAMYAARQYTNNIIQAGVRALSNREKNDVNYEKTYFTEDMFKNETWMDEVLEDLNSPVYITLDGSVFDPSQISSRYPEPGGLKFYTVITLLKRIFKSKEVLGMDIVNISPHSDDLKTEWAIATLMMKVITFKNLLSRK